MKTSRFNESQIIKAIKEHEGGRKAEAIVRDLGISQGTFYKWKQKYGGMEASDVKRLKDLVGQLHKTLTFCLSVCQGFLLQLMLQLFYTVFCTCVENGWFIRPFLLPEVSVGSIDRTSPNLRFSGGAS
jgi:hypothetical protein